MKTKEEVKEVEMENNRNNLRLGNGGRKDLEERRDVGGN